MNGNSITLEGNMTRDPEVRFTTGGTPVTNFGIARNKTVQGTRVPQYFDITVWGEQGQNVAESLVKGDRVIVEGHLDYRTWTTDDGLERSKVSITAETVAPVLRWATIENIVRNERTATTTADPDDQVVDAELVEAGI